MITTRSTGQAFEAQFRRYECKYLIDEASAFEACHYIRPYVEIDPHATRSSDNSYDIVSLYLDAPDLRLFWESREGLLNRIKLRLRNYDLDADAPVFMEIKRRFNRLVLKGRARIGREAVATLLAGGVPDTSRLKGAERACYDEFVGWVARWTAQPVVWVKYRREAYVGIYNPGVRVTFDRGLSCAPAANGSRCQPDGIWRPVESRGVIMELKFNVSFPDWMRHLVQRFELRQQSYSKYGKSILRGLQSSYAF